MHDPTARESLVDSFVVRRMKQAALARWQSSGSKQSSFTRCPDALHLTDDSDTSTESSSSRTNCSVSFGDEPAIRLIPMSHEYSADEFESLYYSQEEQEDILEDAKDLANGWTMNIVDSNRGLEDMSVNGERKALERRNQAIDAVLEEQRRQQQQDGRSKAKNADEILAEVSRYWTMENQDRAYERGYKDELESMPRQTKIVSVAAAESPFRRPQLTKTSTNTEPSGFFSWIFSSSNSLLEGV